MHYRDYWFWIDDRDWRTKRAFTAIMFFFTLAEGGSPEFLKVLEKGHLLLLDLALSRPVLSS